MSKTATSSKSPYPWIVHPLFDLLLICGGGVWLFTGLYLWAARGQNPSFDHWNIVGIAVLTHLFSNSHTAATYFRLAGSAGSRQKFRFHWSVSAAVSILLIAVAIQQPPLAAALVGLYVLWVVQHYHAQTYGIALIYCYKQGYRVSPYEKSSLFALIYAVVAFVIVRKLTFTSYHLETFVGNKLPFWGPLPLPFFYLAKFALIGCAANYFGVLIVRTWHEKSLMPLPALFILFSGTCFLMLTGSVSSALWLYVPALYHGSQYLAVSSTYRFKEQGLPSGISNREIVKAYLRPRGLFYLVSVVAIGAIVYELLPRAIARFGVPFEVALGSVFAVFNFHHFIADAAIWRIRDADTRRVLLA